MFTTYQCGNKQFTSNNVDDISGLITNVCAQHQGLMIEIYHNWCYTNHVRENVDKVSCGVDPGRIWLLVSLDIITCVT